MKKISALIIDDEQLARESISAYLEYYDNIKVAATCSNGFDGFKLINELRPDLVFLDIKMPKISGFEMLELLENPPLIIFSTAYDQYALKAFEHNAVDYLLKPYSKQRFDEAIAKAINRIEMHHDTSEAVKALVDYHRQSEEILTRVVVKTGFKIHIIPVQDIIYIEAMDDYVRIYAKDTSYIKQATMKYFEHHLPVDAFVRCHRSYIVAIKNILRLEPYQKDSYVAVLTNQARVKVSKSGYKLIKKVLDF